MPGAWLGPPACRTTSRWSPRCALDPAAATGNGRATRRGPVDAAFVASDVVARGDRASARPARVLTTSVVGFDDIPSRRSSTRAHGPPAGLRPGAGRRDRAARPRCRPVAAGSDPAADRADRPLIDVARHRRERAGAGTLIANLTSLGGQEEMGRGRPAVRGKESRMQQRSTTWLRVAAVVGAAALVFAACSNASSSGSGKSVTVIGTWGGDEEKAFKQMVAPWEQQTGNTVKYTGTRASTRRTTGPWASADLAGLPGPGQMAQYAKAGAPAARRRARLAKNGKRGPALALVEPARSTARPSACSSRRGEGLIWYSPSSTTTRRARRRRGRPQTRRGQPGRSRGIWCVGPVRRGLRLARHRGLGHRPPPAGPESTTSGGEAR